MAMEEFFEIIHSSRIKLDYKLEHVRIIYLLFIYI